MKKEKNIEKKIYELLGIKLFKKMVMRLMYLAIIPLTIEMNKEERINFFYGTSTNYTIGKINGIEDIKRFKKYLILNASIHIGFLVLCLSNFMEIIGGVSSLSTSASISNLTWVGIHFYCIILQRYNNIRINEVLEKYKELEKRKEEKKEVEILDCDLCSANQFEQAEKKEQTLSSIETYYWNTPILPLEQMDSNLEKGFTRVLRK